MATNQKHSKSSSRRDFLKAGLAGATAYALSQAPNILIPKYRSVAEAQTIDFNNPDVLYKVMTHTQAIQTYGTESAALADNAFFPSEDVLMGAKVQELFDNYLSQNTGVVYDVVFREGVFGPSNSQNSIETPTKLSGAKDSNGGLLTSFNPNAGIAVYSHLEAKDLIMPASVGTFGYAVGANNLIASGSVTGSFLSNIYYTQGAILGVNTTNPVTISDNVIETKGIAISVRNSSGAKQVPSSLVIRNNLFKNASIAFSVEGQGVDAGALTNGGNNTFQNCGTVVNVQPGTTQDQSFSGNAWAGAQKSLITDVPTIEALYVVNNGSGNVDVSSPLGSDPNANLESTLLGTAIPTVPAGAPVDGLSGLVVTAGAVAGAGVLALRAMEKRSAPYEIIGDRKE